MSDSTRAYRSPLREQEALRTRAAILGAAQELFTAQGFARVTMGDIAVAAGVALKTVYASVGAKSDVLHQLIEASMAESTSPQILADLRKAGDAASAIALVAHGTRTDNEQHLALVELLQSSAAGDKGARDTLDRVVELYRGALTQAAKLMVRRKLLAPGLGTQAVADRLWLCFGLGAWHALVVDCRWSFDEAERVLCRQGIALLTDP